MFNSMECQMYDPVNPWQWYYFFMPKKEYYAFEAYFQIESYVSIIIPAIGSKLYLLMIFCMKMIKEEYFPTKILTY